MIMSTVLTIGWHGYESRIYIILEFKIMSVVRMKPIFFLRSAVLVLGGFGGIKRLCRFVDDDEEPMVTWWVVSHHIVHTDITYSRCTG